MTNSVHTKVMAADKHFAAHRGDPMHLLELIPFFRQWRPSLLRNIVYTFIVGLLFAAFFFALDLPRPDNELRQAALVCFVVAESCVFLIYLFITLTYRYLGRWLTPLNKLRRFVYLVVSIIGFYAGNWMGYGLLRMPSAQHSLFTTQAIIGSLVICSVITAMIAAAYVIRDKQAKVEAALAEERQRALEIERQAMAAQLRMLQAQIEPHFLYNTLANAVGLIQPAPDRARLLLERLIDYLRATLVSSRESQSTVQFEMQTIAAYLDLMKVRMGERLQYRISISDGLDTVCLPPMLVQPIVENAIQHGLEPKIEGGEISVCVDRFANQLRVTVSDTGCGFNPASKVRPGGGVGLSNLRERLQVLYGASATLSITDNVPQGVKVTMSLPLADVAPARNAA